MCCAQIPVCDRTIRQFVQIWCKQMRVHANFFCVLYRVTQEGVLNRLETDMTWIRYHTLLCLHALRLACKCLRVISLSVSRSSSLSWCVRCGNWHELKKNRVPGSHGTKLNRKLLRRMLLLRAHFLYRCVVTSPYCLSWFSSADM